MKKDLNTSWVPGPTKVLKKAQVWHITIFPKSRLAPQQERISLWHFLGFSRYCSSHILKQLIKPPKLCLTCFQ